MSAKAQRKKQTERDSVKRMRRLIQNVERLSVGVPQNVLDAMEIEGVFWTQIANHAPVADSKRSSVNSMLGHVFFGYRHIHQRTFVIYHFHF